MIKSAQYHQLLKSIVFTVLTVIFFPFYLSNESLVYAQELPPQNWQCMSVSQVDSHTVNLTTKEGNFFAPPQSNVYIVECVSSALGNACSTGDTNADSVLGLSGMSGFSITNSFSQPVKAAIDGKTENEPHRRKTDGPDVNHSFYGVQLTENVDYSASGTNLKLSSFYPTNSDTNCVSLRWDPTGIVFDSKTLEPIPGVSLTIYDKNGSKVNLAGVPNPDITGENGQYNFNVEPNNYYSLVTQSSTHTFPSTISPLPAQDDSDFPYRGIYRGGQFFETPKILRLDIPVDSPTRFVREAKITDWKIALDKPLNLYKIDGGVSHPFSIVKVYNANKLVGKGTADQYGKFVVNIDSAIVDNTADLELFVEKAAVYYRIQKASPPLTQSSLIDQFIHKLIPEVNAQTAISPIKIDPILNYLEGYAVDENGQPVPNATVQIILTVATKPSYQTKADNTGYFRISSQYIPPLPYNIVIKSPTGKSTSLTTLQFTNLNKNISPKNQNNQVNYGEYRTTANSQNSPQSGGSESSSLNQTSDQTGKSNTSARNSDNEATTPNLINNQLGKTANRNSTVILLIIFAIVLTIGIIIYYTYRKNKSLKKKTSHLGVPET